MGLLSALLGNAAQADVEEVERDLERLLAEDEKVERAFKLIRDLLIFTNRRFIKRSGFIAKEGRTIPLNRISGVDFEIGVIDRIFGCGTLVVSDASTDGSVLLHDIPDVEKVQLQVSDELHRLASGDRRDDGA